MSPLALTRAPPSAPSPTGRQGPWQVRQDVGRRHREGAQVEAERHPQEVGGLDPLRPECPDAPRGRGDAAPLGGPWGRVCWYPGWGAGAGALERRLHAIPSTCDFGCAPRMCVRPRYQVACACAGTLLPETRSGVSVVAAPNSTVCPTDVSSLARGRCAVRLYIKSRVDHTAERTQRSEHTTLHSPAPHETHRHTHTTPPPTQRQLDSTPRGPAPAPSARSTRCHPDVRAGLGTGAPRSESTCPSRSDPVTGRVARRGGGKSQILALT